MDCFYQSGNRSKHVVVLLLAGSGQMFYSMAFNNKKPTNWWGRQNAKPKALGGGIFGRFLNIDKCRSEVAGDVISHVALDYFGMDVRATFGESGVNSDWII